MQNVWKSTFFTCLRKLETILLNNTMSFSWNVLSLSHYQFTVYLQTYVVLIGCRNEIRNIICYDFIYAYMLIRFVY